MVWYDMLKGETFCSHMIRSYSFGELMSLEQNFTILLKKKKIPCFPHMKKKHQYELDFGISFPLSRILELGVLQPSPQVDDTFIKSQQVLVYDEMLSLEGRSS